MSVWIERLFFGCVARHLDRARDLWLANAPLRFSVDCGGVSSADRWAALIVTPLRSTPPSVAARWIVSLICGFVRKFIRSLDRSSMSFVGSSNVRVPVLLKLCPRANQEGVPPANLWFAQSGQLVVEGLSSYGRAKKRIGLAVDKGYDGREYERGGGGSP